MILKDKPLERMNYDMKNVTGESYFSYCFQQTFVQANKEDDFVSYVFLVAICDPDGLRVGQ